MTGVLENLARLLDLGGVVVLILLALSVVTVSTALFKLWQFSTNGVGQHQAILDAIDAWDAGDRAAAVQALSHSKSYFAPVVEMSFSATTQDFSRLEAEAETRFAGLERGFRMLDSIAQIAPLLGLFGTVLGMIEAFRAMQQAGAQVDPSLLAGGIWVALLTTAVGLGVAMPTSVILSWFESRMDSERIVAERALSTVLHPQAAMSGAPKAEGAPSYV